MDRTRFCLIGAGRAGMVHARNLAFNIKNADLTAIVDIDSKVAGKRGEELGVTNLFTDLDEALSSDLFDAVVVVTPTFTHREILVKCAEAKKHVFCEKPMSIRPEEARAMIEATSKNSVKLQIGFMRRFDPPFLHAREVIDSGELGEVMIVKSVGRGPGLPPPWTYNVAESNGLLGEVNSHDFDSTRWLAGSEYRRVYAEAVNRKVKKLEKEYPDFYDNVVCTVRFDNDVIGTIDGTCPVDYGYDARTEIVLTGGLISIGEVRGQAYFSCDVHGVIRENAWGSWRNRFKDAYLDEMRSFITSVTDDRPTLVTGQDGLATVQAVVAANRSLKSGAVEEVGS
ncbi:MAG: Gfo/Idh/MocA family oxidoreductase [Spirochaetes bacterium]|nr:Gfo/Idh/MocA family oxidoreductase [Spirochaetota bacterium]